MIEISNDINSLQNNNPIEINLKYVQVKKKINEKNVKLLQIIDISQQMVAELQQEDKKLINQLKTTVQEMKNPISSLNSQNMI